jgi:arylsulfatase
VGAAAIGARALEEAARPYRTPAALPEGQAARIGESFRDSRPASFTQPTAPRGAPNIVVIVLDDVGFADLGCYGSEIRTPHLDALAQRGLRYANFRTCAMCSPTRAALLTGLNHHSAGMGWLADIDAGFPGYRGDLTHDATTAAEVLSDEGWSTFLVGKWHVNYVGTNGPNGPYDNWPTSRGFERAYWFQGHSTDYFKPSELFDGRAPVEPPQTEDYYVNDDLTERAMMYVRTQKALAPDKPFLLQLAFPGAHSPLQVRPAERDAYKGAYDTGWDVARAQRLARQKEMGLLPETTELPPLSFGADQWDTLSPVQKRLYARYMEVFAAMVTNIDTNVGRLMETLEALDALDNTLVIVISDNGGSAEGTPTGTPNVFAPAFGRPIPVEAAAEFYDIMGEDGTFPHYPMGWTNVSNTPFRLYKQYAHLGGVADPLIVSWPDKIAARGEVRQQFVHVVDLFPTMLEAAGVARPESYRGRPLKPLEGQSILPTFASPQAPTRTEQYFELAGSRAYQDGNWRLVSRHQRGSDFADDLWELYDLSQDPNELNNLAAAQPERLAALQAKWTAAADRYGVFPLDDRNLVLRLVQDRQDKGIKPRWDFRPPIDRIARDLAPIVCGLSHEIEVTCSRAGEGVLLAHGSKHAGYVLYVRNNRLVYEQSLVPWIERIEASVPLPAGEYVVKYVQTMRSRPFDGDGALFINGRRVATHRFERVLFSTSYDGFTIGADLGNQVSAAYRGTNPFTGTIQRVVIDVDGRPTNPIETQRFLDEMGLRV